MLRLERKKNQTEILRLLSGESGFSFQRKDSFSHLMVNVLELLNTMLANNVNEQRCYRFIAQIF